MTVDGFSNKKVKLVAEQVMKCVDRFMILKFNLSGLDDGQEEEANKF